MEEGGKEGREKAKEKSERDKKEMGPKGNGECKVRSHKYRDL